jgi:hypothetical protein
VCSLVTPIPFTYDDTAVYETWTVNSTNATRTGGNDAWYMNMSSANDNGASEGAFKNDGTAPAHILQWTITNNIATNITSVELGDSSMSGESVQGNKITWNGTLGNGQVLRLYMFKMVDHTFKKLYYTVDNVLSGSRDFDGTEPPFIVAGATNQVFSVKITTTSASPSATVRADWRDTYWMS